jgi:gluconolactonase
MNSSRTLAVAVSISASAVLLAQTTAPRLPSGEVKALSVQAPLDPGYSLLTATCKTAPPARGGRGPGGNRGAGRAAAPAGERAYTVPGIAGVVKGGEKWKFVWQQAGNNGDGIVGLNDGSLLLAQNDSSDVLKLTPDGRTSVAYANTRTGGAVSINSKGATFVDERGLHQRIEQLTPTRKVLADTYNGDPLDCIGGVINDISADSKGGVYFTMGGLYYADPAGKVTRYGENLTTNGIILSADEKTLYVTNGPAIAAFDVQKDGSLTNQREFTKLSSGGGDGSTIDSKGRLYVTTNGGVEVIGKDGKSLGVIGTPRGAISVAFGGKGRKTTLFALLRGGTDAQGADQANVAQVWALPMIADSYKGRAK